jgi:6-phosphofructokinase 1
MVALQNDRIIPVDLKDVVGKPNPVAVDHQLVLTGRALGICFGD